MIFVFLFKPLFRIFSQGMIFFFLHLVQLHMYYIYFVYELHCIAVFSTNVAFVCNYELNIFCNKTPEFINMFKSIILIPIWTILDVASGYPTIRINPELKAVEKDRTVEMKCMAIAMEAEHLGPPEITWIKDYIPVDMSDPRISVLDEGMHGCFNENYFVLY